MPLMPQFLAQNEPCPQCDRLALLGIQWVDTQPTRLSGTDGSPVVRALEKFTLCLWCLHREHSALTPKDVANFKVIEAIAGQEVTPYESE